MSVEKEKRLWGGVKDSESFRCIKSRRVITSDIRLLQHCLQPWQMPRMCPGFPQWSFNSASLHKGMQCYNTMEKQPVSSKHLRISPFPTQAKTSEPLVLVWSRWLSSIGRVEQMSQVQPASVPAVWTRQARDLLLSSGGFISCLPCTDPHRSGLAS